MQPPSQFSALPPADIRKASPKAISRRTSYLRVRLEFLRYPQVIRAIFNLHRFGPPVTRFRVYNRKLNAHFRLGFPSAPYFLVLNLACSHNSSDRSTKSTPSSFNALRLLVNTGFQVLFHSPPGVLFTFPSRYYFTIGHRLVFRLGGWSPRLPTRFLVSRGTLDTPVSFIFRIRGLYPLWRSLS